MYKRAIIEIFKNYCDKNEVVKVYKENKENILKMVVGGKIDWDYGIKLYELNIKFYYWFGNLYDGQI